MKTDSTGPADTGPPERRRALEAALARFPRVAVTHAPTALEPLPNLGAELGLTLYVKRDDCTGFGFGGNKVRQLEFYIGEALARRADTILITGALQSNYARTAAAMARRFGMDCHLQLEERVPDVDDLHRRSGNVLLDRLLGATLHSYPDGEDEAGADAALAAVAGDLRAAGRTPYLIPLGPDHPPLGALGYVAAALELTAQCRDAGLTFDAVVLPSGSAFTHAGLLTGLRALGDATPVLGVCVRRAAHRQRPRVAQRCRGIAGLLGPDVLPGLAGDTDIRVDDGVLAPGYGRLNPAVNDAIRLSARCEGLFLDPVYSGRAMAGLIAAARAGRLRGARVLFLHTGGLPALFAYGERLLA